MVRPSALEMEGVSASANCSWAVRVGRELSFKVEGGPDPRVSGFSDPRVKSCPPTFSAGGTGLSPESMVPSNARATLPMMRRMGAPTGQPQDSPGQRPGSLRPDSASPEGATLIWNRFTNHGLDRPFRAWMDRDWDHPGRCPGLAWAAPLALPGHARHRLLGSVAWADCWVPVPPPLARTDRIRFPADGFRLSRLPVAVTDGSEPKNGNGCGDQPSPQAEPKAWPMP